MGNNCSILSEDERPKQKQKRSNTKTKQTTQSQQRPRSRTPSVGPSANSSSAGAITNNKVTPAQQRLNKDKKKTASASDDTFVVAPRQQQKNVGAALTVDDQRKTSNTSEDRNRIASVGGVSSGPKSPHQSVAPLMRTTSPGGDYGNQLNMLPPVQMMGSELCASSSLGAVVLGPCGPTVGRNGGGPLDGEETEVPFLVADVLHGPKGNSSPPPRKLPPPGGERPLGSNSNSRNTASDTLPYPGATEAAKNPFMSSSAPQGGATLPPHQQPSRGGAHFSALDFNGAGQGGSAASYCPTFGSSQSFSSAGSVADSFGSRRISAAQPTALELPRLESVGAMDERDVKIPKKWRAHVTS